MDDSEKNEEILGENARKASLSNIMQAKERISKEIKSIEQNINEIDKAKQKSIDIIESKKKLLLEQDEVEDVYEEHKKVLQELAITEKEIEARKVSITLLDETIAQLDIQIAQIQAEYDRAVAELESKKRRLNEYLDYYNQLGLKFAKLAELLQKENANYEQQLNSLLQEREKLLLRTDLSETTLQAKLKELDDQIANLNKEHDTSVKSLNKLFSEIASESITKQEIAKELAQAKGLSQEHILKLTDLEGLAITDRPEFSVADEESVIDSGKIGYRYPPRGYYFLDKLDYDYTTARSASDFETEERYEARETKLAEEHMFRKFLQYAGQVTPISASTYASSSESHLSSKDVEYLKNVFGKCLSLALAEITAIQPSDPIHYLAHWLMKYRYNREHNAVREAEIMALMVERDKLEAIRLRQESQKQAQEAISDILDKVNMIALEQELERLAMLAAEMQEG